MNAKKLLCLACLIFSFFMFYGAAHAEEESEDTLNKNKATVSDLETMTEKGSVSDGQGAALNEKTGMKGEAASEGAVLEGMKKTKEKSKTADDEKKSKKILEPVRPFGYDFFDASPASFLPDKDVSAPADYTMGPGDTVKIVLFSPVGQQDQYTLKVDADGNIYVPAVGRMSVSGLTRGKLEEQILAALNAKFPQLQGYVTIEKLRTIRVYVTGEAKRPGGYVISGLSTAFNALYVAGGPNERGSMRNIQVLRNNKLVGTIDLYAYLLKGDRSSDILLQPEDTIFIPVLKTQVTAKGEVLRTAMYELLEGESNLGTALQLAGGIKATGYAHRIQIERVQKNKEKIVLDVSLLNDAAAALKNGDVITVFPVVDIQQNVVWVEGHVQRPGIYEVKENMSVLQLIQEAEGLNKIDEVYLDRADIVRVTPEGAIRLVSFNLQKALMGEESENIKIQPFDVLKIYSIDEAIFVDRTLIIGGAVKSPGTYRRTDNMSLRDLINVAGGTLPEALPEAEVARAQGEKEGIIMKVSLGGQEAEKILLGDGDVVTVKLKGQYLRRLPTVTITGETYNPGLYALKHDHETLYDVLQRAGGFPLAAFPEGAVFQRNLENITTKEQLTMTQNVQQALNYIVEQQYNIELAKHGVAPVKTEEQSISIPNVPVSTEELQRLGKLTAAYQQVETLLSTEVSSTKTKGVLAPQKVKTLVPKERIIVDLVTLMQSKGSVGNIVLRDGDTLFVPKKPLTVSVVGAVVNPSNIVYEDKKSIDYYVNSVGGYAEDANRGRVIVLKPNGAIYPRKKIKAVERGDIIIVPPKPFVITDKKTWWEKTKEAVKVISDTATAVFIIRSLRELSTR